MIPPYVNIDNWDTYADSYCLDSQLGDHVSITRDGKTIRVTLLFEASKDSKFMIRKQGKPMTGHLKCSSYVGYITESADTVYGEGQFVFFTNAHIVPPVSSCP